MWRQTSPRHQEIIPLEKWDLWTDPCTAPSCWRRVGLDWPLRDQWVKSVPVNFSEQSLHQCWVCSLPVVWVLGGSRITESWNDFNWKILLRSASPAFNPALPSPPLTHIPEMYKISRQHVQTWVAQNWNGNKPHNENMRWVYIKSQLSNIMLQWKVHSMYMNENQLLPCVYQKLK